VPKRDSSQVISTSGVPISEGQLTKINCLALKKSLRIEPLKYPEVLSLRLHYSRHAVVVYGGPPKWISRLCARLFNGKTGELAERVGFEPTLEFPLNTLSKRAPSATRPSLPHFCPERILWGCDGTSNWHSASRIQNSEFSIQQKPNGDAQLLKC
jgi:hypothetical protein